MDVSTRSIKLNLVHTMNMVRSPIETRKGSPSLWSSELVVGNWCVIGHEEESEEIAVRGEIYPGFVLI